MIVLMQRQSSLCGWCVALEPSPRHHQANVCSTMQVQKAEGRQVDFASTRSVRSIGNTSTTMYEWLSLAPSHAVSIGMPQQARFTAASSQIAVPAACITFLQQPRNEAESRACERCLQKTARRLDGACQSCRAPPGHLSSTASTSLAADFIRRIWKDHLPQTQVSAGICFVARLK